MVEGRDRWVVSGEVFSLKQKTSYEMRISDWSSDECSSDIQNAERQRLQLLSVGAAFGLRHGNEVPPVENAGHVAKRKERARQWRRLGIFRAGELARPAAEDFAAGQELQGRRVGRAFGFNKHGLHLVIDGAGIKGCALSPTPSHGGWPPPDWPETADGKVKGHIC